MRAAWIEGVGARSWAGADGLGSPFGHDTYSVWGLSRDTQSSSSPLGVLNVPVGWAGAIEIDPDGVDA